MRFRRAPLVAAPLSLAIVCPLAHAYDLSFDYTSFGSGFGQSQFDVLNYKGINGRYMMTSGDNHRPEMVANGNNLAEFYNWVQQRYDAHTTKDGNLSADEIDQYVIDNAANNGPKPTWLIMNEISSSLWSANAGPPSNSTYRTWLIDCVTRLTDHYGYDVVMLAPFQNPTANDASWQALSAKAYIGPECYLSGTEVWNSGSTNAARLAWAQSQYQASKNSYIARGVPANRIFVTEYFGNTNTTFINSQGNVQAVGWGRAGLASAADWDTVLQLRQDAIKAVGFDGFLAYSWGSNGMNVTLEEQIQHEYWYRTRLVLAGQQPQWLADNTYTVNGAAIPLSWNQQLNWLGGVPNASGAIANFFRTNTAARTITLDGSKTIGTLSFNSAASYTINAGTGGSLTLNNAASPASVTVAQGTHTIGVPLILANSANFSITGTLTQNAGMSSTAAGTITRSGGGTWTLSGAQAYAVGSVLNLDGGTTNWNSDAGGNLTINANATVNFGSSQKLQGLSVAAGKTVTLTTGGSKVINANTVSSAGKLDLKSHALIARSGTIGSWNGTNYTGMLGLVRSGRNGGAWNGNGIITTMTAALTGTPLMTLATATASEALGITASQTTTWRGQSINGSAILIAYTYAGDANISGAIDIDDYFQIDSAYNDPVTSLSYFKGDFNYDGRLDGDDYFLIDSNFQAQSAARLPSGAVPEPAGVALLALAGGVGMSRRRRLSL